MGDFSLEIPDKRTVVPTVNSSAFLKVEYVLNLYATVGHLARDLKLRIPLRAVSQRQAKEAADTIHTVEEIDHSNFTKSVSISAGHHTDKCSDGKKPTTEEEAILIDI